MTRTERGPGARHAETPEVDTTGEQLDELSLPPSLDDWREQLHERVEHQQARRTAEGAARAQMAARRVKGLRARHAAKLRRSGGGDR